MVGQRDQLRRQSPLNRPEKCRCWYGVEASTLQLFITSRLSRTVKRKVMVLMMITFIAAATEGTSAVSLSLLIVFVAFVELAEEKFTMLDWKLDPSKLGFS